MALTPAQQAIRQVFAELTSGDRQNSDIESQIVLADERRQYRLWSCRGTSKVWNFKR